MVYAPVIIPTLNRFDHLKQCIDSLNMNHNADKTDVYISVDYPPSEKYWDGYLKICHYLDNGKFNFKNLYVIKQEKNLGIVNDGKKKYSNFSFLVNLVREKYDRWIISEDDNVFSPNFLDFINLGLEKFEKDKSVYAVCGYQFYYNLKFGDNNFVKQHSDFNAWGYGIWKNRYEEIKYVRRSYLLYMLFNPIELVKVWRISKTRVMDLIGLSYKGSFKKADNFLTLYMIHENMYQVMPTISKVRNIGWDGSGMHCSGFVEGTAERHMNQTIDESQSFEKFLGSGLEFEKENSEIIRREDYRQISTIQVVKALVRRILFFWK